MCHVVGIFRNHLTIISHEVRSTFILVSCIQLFVVSFDVPLETFLLTFYFETKSALHLLLTCGIFPV